jgi:ribokinase
MMMAEIVVIGSINMDLVVRTTRMPLPGETLHGEDLNIIPGGKGANQAAAVAKMGSDIAMIGRVGSDVFGQKLIAELEAAGVNTKHILTTAKSASGTALIIVDQKGQNSIVVSPGANGTLLPADILANEELIRQSKILILQFEIPLETVQCAVEIATKYHVKVILNPAPAKAVSRDLLSLVDILVPNETEASQLSGIQVVDIASAEAAAKALLSSGVGIVVITLGEKGALLATSTAVRHVPSVEVKAVDTTAAGDAFVGGLAAALVQGLSPEDAVRYATCAGALAVTKFGAQTSLPTKAEVDRIFYRS